MAREYLNGNVKRIGSALILGALALLISFALALIYPSVSICLLAAMMLLLNSLLLALRTAPDRRISRIFHMKSKRNRRYLIVAIPVGTALAAAFFAQGIKGLAIVMWGAMFIGAIRLYVSSDRPGARGGFSSIDQ
ncbi:MULTISPECIES: hypothetical protein [unclassified Streptomyces]|uniref:hypothetical protein n=1 Tax=unclassified Streptomyces TaxID=2593676 RepID=UPI00117DD32A|nr:MULTISPECIES: hypothetical protein [unclassified Streptomyces]MYX04211.1 hypothetical protein [Streptomyces sp. SID8378]